MSYLESVHIAWRTLGVNRTRSVLTVLGIIIGVAAVVCMAAVGAGARSQVTEGIQSLGTNILHVSPGAAQSGGTRLAAGTGHTLTEEDAAAILREVADVEIASPMISRQAQVITGNRNWSTTVTRQRFRLSHRPRMGAGPPGDHSALPRSRAAQRSRSSARSWQTSSSMARRVQGTLCALAPFRSR